MGICEVKSPVSTNTPGSKLHSNLPLSPGARSDPGRRDSVPNQPPHAARKGDQQPASVSLTGPADFPVSFVNEPGPGHEADPSDR
jgi:hypothetical protein